MYAVTPNRKSSELTLSELMFAGAFSAGPTTLVMAPVERVKVVMQTNPHLKGFIDATRHVYREGGLKSVFRGSGATLLRDAPGSAMYFWGYEITRQFLTPKGSDPKDLHPAKVMVAGGMAGVAMWSIAIPPDVVKSRLQAAPPGTYSGTYDCFVKLVRAEGPAALFRGLGPALIRAFPANAAAFLGVDLSRKALDSMF